VTPDITERLRAIKTLPSLIAYLRDELDWPISQDMVEDDLTFEYKPEELGFTRENAVGIKEIKQLRPMKAGQPWGIFWVNFEKKRLPVVMLRRILGNLVVKRHGSAGKPSQPAWQLNDLLFISAYGEEADRSITFAHFAKDAASPGDLPVLRVLGWDGGDTVLHLADAHRTLALKLHWPPDPDNLAGWRDQWSGAFTLRHREVISTTKELVEELAKLATSIRKRAETILTRETERGPMRRLYAAFRTALIHDLSEPDFADVIAQTITYGLLAAKFSRPAGISVDNLVDMIPPTNPFLRELLGEFLSIAGRKRGAFDFDELGIQDVVILLNQAQTEAVKADFGNRTRNEDPVIHFYEHFLAAYDKKKKVQRGVFYTPQPVVSYIVRSVHELLQTEFGLADGLADTTTWGEMADRCKGLKIPDGAQQSDPFVCILDPATGTATFLVEAIEVIFTHLQVKWTAEGKSEKEISSAWNEYVPKYLLPRLYGYELMMAPYSIAHMKLWLKLSEINTRLGQPGYEARFEGRAHIYLTNSLEPANNDEQGVLEGIFPALAHEAAAVNRVKKGRRFTVIMGNPPYSARSYNLTAEARALVEPYKYINGNRIVEKGALQLEKNLNDDYVKFIRFAQICANMATGIAGMITNHSFLENPTLRGMRWSLLQTFPKMDLLDLGGNIARKLQAKDGAPDENVFDIGQGVAISLLAATGKRKACQDIRCGALLGSRQMKYDWLEHHSQHNAGLEVAEPAPELYLYRREDVALRKEYDQYVTVSAFFPLNSTGVKTHRDGFCIDFDETKLRKRINDLVSESHSDHELRDLYGIPDTYGWALSTCRKRLRQDAARNSHYTSILYRPFDWRPIYFSPDVIELARMEVSQHFLGERNIGLIFMRQVASDEPYSHFGVTRHPVDNRAFYSNRGTMSFAPLYLFGVGEGDMFSTGGQPATGLNVDPRYVQLLQRGLKVQLATESKLSVGHIAPEDIFHYIYAVFHSPTYRTRYAEFLKIDFPRLPLTSSIDLFRALATLGGELVALHLMESPKLSQHITDWIGSSGAVIEKVTYSDEMVWIDKAKSKGFEGVPEPAWSFHIGGYQVCEKWLKDRKGRMLSGEDIEHYHKIVVALSETIRIMAEIDQVIDRHGGWPGAFTK